MAALTLLADTNDILMQLIPESSFLLGPTSSSSRKQELGWDGFRNVQTVKLNRAPTNLGGPHFHSILQDTHRRALLNSRKWGK